MPEGGGGQLIAAQEGRRLIGAVGRRELPAALSHVRCVQQLDGAGEVIGPGDELRIEAEDDAVVAVEALGKRLLVGLGLADGYESIGPSGRNLASVELVGKCAVDDVLR